MRYTKKPEHVAKRVSLRQGSHVYARKSLNRPFHDQQRMVIWTHRDLQRGKYALRFFYGRNLSWTIYIAVP